MSSAVLSYAKLAQANLTGAVLDGANLLLANLVNADLTGAVLDGIDLSMADLTDANLTGAILGRAIDISGTIFCNTTMPDGTKNYSGCQ